MRGGCDDDASGWRRRRSRGRVVRGSSFAAHLAEFGRGGGGASDARASPRRGASASRRRTRRRGERGARGERGRGRRHPTRGAVSSDPTERTNVKTTGKQMLRLDRRALDEKAVSVPATQKFKTGTRYVCFFVHSRSLVPRLQIGRNANCHFERDNACRSLLVREDANGVRPRAARAPVLPGAFDPARYVAARSRARAPPSAPRAPRARFSSVSPLALGVARARPTVAKKTHRSPRGNNNWPDGGWHRVCDRP